MLSTRKIEEIIGIILILGTLFSAVFVFIGGALYLLQHGSENMQTEILLTYHYPASIWQAWLEVISLTPIGMIELGLFSLILTQILRVTLLTCYYVAIRDYWFISIGTFILIVLVYSFFWRT